MGRRKNENNENESMVNEELVSSGAELVKNDAHAAEVAVQGLATISKDIKESMVRVNRNEARFLVDTYYQTQRSRIEADNQIRAIVQGADDQDQNIPSGMDWISKSMRNQEDQIKKMLGYYAQSTPVGKWMMDVVGIGPVLAAGCLSYFDINRVNHYNQFWSYAGFNDGLNPWLGKEKASKMVKEIYDNLAAEDKEIMNKIEFMNKINNNIDKAKIEAALKKFKKEDLFGSGYIMDESNKHVQALITLLNEILVEDFDRIEDFVIRNFIESKAVTEFVICKVMAKTGRKRSIIVNGLSSTLRSRKDEEGSKSKAVQYLKADLVSYLSKPPYNQKAKQLCYLIGESFVKVSGNKNSLYGRLYRERKSMETVTNENGGYAEWADHCFNDKNWSKGTESYKAYVEGKLPAMQIHRRAKRYAVKMFISHMFEAMYMDKYGKPVPFDIYPIQYLGHSDYIGPEVPFDRYISYTTE